MLSSMVFFVVPCHLIIQKKKHISECHNVHFIVQYIVVLNFFGLFWFHGWL